MERTLEDLSSFHLQGEKSSCRQFPRRGKPRLLSLVAQGSHVANGGDEDDARAYVTNCPSLSKKAKSPSLNLISVHSSNTRRGFFCGESSTAKKKKPPNLYGPETRRREQKNPPGDSPSGHFNLFPLDVSATHVCMDGHTCTYIVRLYVANASSPSCGSGLFLSAPGARRREEPRIFSPAMTRNRHSEPERSKAGEPFSPARSAYGQVSNGKTDGLPLPLGDESKHQQVLLWPTQEPSRERQFCVGNFFCFWHRQLGKLPSS